ncbi:MAG: energy-coupled thiamine transporter ThiT [Clostridia bacterium]|nr:energy-coupled thiamine transporter ThiT [Clostridia bacterium]
MSEQKKKTRMLVEGALFVALAYVLSFIEIKIAWQYGGSIDFVMIPLIIYAIRWGTGAGLTAGLVFGTVKFFLSGGVAVNWQSMLLDYSLAYMFVGFAGVLKNQASLSWLAAVIGCVARFVVHFVSGVTIYAEYMPPVFMGWEMTSPTVYSILYNGSYMLPSAIIAVAGCMALQRGLRPFLEGKDRR